MRAAPEFAKSLKDAGFNIMCLANNHIFDYGPVALSDRIYHLKGNGIYFLGAGDNLNAACEPLILRKNGLNIAFLAFTYIYRAKRKSAGAVQVIFVSCRNRLGQQRGELI